MAGNHTTSAISPQREVAEIASLPATHAAFQWLRSQERGWLKQQIELTAIPAPPFAEQRRSVWVRDQFAKLGLGQVRTDGVGNVLGVHAGRDSEREAVALCAHLDTVFPAETSLLSRQDGNRIYAPGISDNGAGLAALLAVAATLRHAGSSHDADILFVATVGEEGEGNLRGMRHLFAGKAANGDSLEGEDRPRIAYTLNIDGAGTHTVVAQALGSKRLAITIHGPGGHSWSDFGAPNAIVLLARCITAFSEHASTTPAAGGRRTQPPESSFNFGIIRGGHSVNSIPEHASVTLDLRSTSSQEIERLEGALLRVLQDPCYGGARSHERRSGDASQGPQQNRSCNGLVSFPRSLSRPEPADGAGEGPPGPVSHEITCIGERPAGEVRPDARILRIIRAVDSHLGIKSQMHRASTDANIPIALGLEAVSIGGGGQGGGAHTLHEWFDPTGRDLGLKRILLAALALAGAKTTNELS